MAKTKDTTSKLLQGILNPASGEASPIQYRSNGVITGLRDSIPVKRPNQYKKNQ